ncbi:MAG: biotin/lipoyl-containing protein, partial [Pseudomonadota bacterium]
RADRIYFMEMNTRLQVEHPVTEAITGLDLVEWQLRVAAGEALPFAQADLAPQGWSMEARLYAEDPAKGFLPQTGRLAHLRLPGAPARVDAGVREGDAVTPHYDPMIAKVVAAGATRAEALARLASALAETEVGGLTTNLEFLRALCAHPGFAAGDLDTGLIDRDAEALTAARPVPAEAAALALIAALGLDAPAPTADPADPFAARDGFRVWGAETRRAVLEGPEGPMEAQVSPRGGGRFDLPEGRRLTLSGPAEARRVRLGDGPARPTTLRLADGAALVALDGRVHAFAPPDPFAAASEGAGGGDAVTAPMPGLVKRVGVAAGDAVTEGQTLLVLEAMKMEHRLLSPRDGVVERVIHPEGAQVEDGALLVALAPDED